MDEFALFSKITPDGILNTKQNAGENYKNAWMTINFAYVLNCMPNGWYTLPAEAGRPYRPWCTLAWPIQLIIS